MTRRKLSSRISLKGTRGLYLFSIVVGVISGFGAMLFRIVLELATELVYTGLCNVEVTHPSGEKPFLHVFPFDGGEPIWWLMALMPAVGGLVGGWLVFRFAPEAAGHGTDAMIDAFHNKAGKIRGIVPLIKAISTILTLATGGSAGKEGPVAQIGAGFGSTFSNWMGLGARDRRTLLLTGTAGGLGAIFMAPLGGALTAVEVLYREDIESESLIPCIISSVTAYVIYGSVFGFTPVFGLPEGTHFVTTELFVYIALGVLCSGVGYLYVHTFYDLVRDRLFAPMKVKPYLKPAIGGLVVGVIGLISMDAIGTGFGFMQELIYFTKDDLTWKFVGFCLLISLLKIVSTSFTVSSGGSGGVFGPSLVIGGCLGAAVGGAAWLLFPNTMTSPLAAFVVVGMSSFFAGVANAPIAAMIMVSELTGGYSLLAPLMLVSVISLILADRWSIYENQVRNKFYSKAHVSDMTIDVLQDILVADLAPYHTICICPPHTLYHSAEALSQKFHASDFVLSGADGKLEGMVSLRDTHFDVEDPFIASLVTLEDIKSTKVPFLIPENNLHEALEVLLTSEFDKIPILSSRDKNANLLGYLLYQDILEKYHQITRSSPAA